MTHHVNATCRHLGPHASAADHWMLIGEYESPVNGRPIIAIATLASTNSKVTGASRIPTAGVYILSADTDPRVLARRRQDSAICGDCPMSAQSAPVIKVKGRRKRLGRSCYVRLGQGALWAWRRYSAGEYRPFDVNAFDGLFVRLGEYGDPGFMPLDTVAALVDASAGHTGYTHAWTYRPREYSRYLMASVSTTAAAERARAMGYRTFRVRAPGEALELREFSCPASAEENHRLTCTQCGACNGAGDRATRASVSIIAHGARKRAAALAGVNE